MNRVESQWQVSAGILVTRLQGMVTVDDVGQWRSSLGEALAQIEDDSQFKLLADLSGYEPAAIQAHKEMRSIIPLTLARYGLCLTSSSQSSCPYRDHQKSGASFLPSCESSQHEFARPQSYNAERRWLVSLNQSAPGFWWSLIQSKIVAMAFTMAAEIERDLISQRTKEALAARKRSGKPVGRPKGSGKSKLDKHREEIENRLQEGATQKYLASRFHTSPTNLSRWMQKHGLKRNRG